MTTPRVCPEAEPNSWLKTLSDLGLAESFETEHFLAGSRIVERGEPGHSFYVIWAGSASVVQAEASRTKSESLGPGSLVGEISLLTGNPRRKTVVAQTEVWALKGGIETFQKLVSHKEISSHFVKTAAKRLATLVEPITIHTHSGLQVILRPLLWSDRDRYVETLKRQSDDTLRKRFFTPGQPPPGVIRYLLDIDYSSHWAWIAADPAQPDRTGLGIARYIADRHSPGAANIAVGIADSHQGRGLGPLLLGATAITARQFGYEALTAEILSDNLAVKSLFDKAGAEWSLGEPGTLVTELEAGQLIAFLDATDAQRIANGTSELVNVVGPHPG